jgi:hypothetical protein
MCSLFSFFQFWAYTHLVSYAFGQVDVVLGIDVFPIDVDVLMLMLMSGGCAPWGVAPHA